MFRIYYVIFAEPEKKKYTIHAYYSSNNGDNIAGRIPGFTIIASIDNCIKICRALDTLKYKHNPA